MSTVLGHSENPRVNRPDPYPKIRPAGFQQEGVTAESADYSIREQVHVQNPGTPDHLKKFRKSHVNQPGTIQRHYGVADDPLVKAPAFSYGKSTHSSEHVSGVIKAQDMAGMQDKFNDIKEGQYASHVREPLGNGYERGYNWPEQTQNGKMEFGVPTTGLVNAKELLYPRGGGVAEQEAFASQYRKTHGNFAPGEQKNRDYNWKFDPADHRFGYGEQKVLNGASQAVHHERPEEQFPKTVIVKKTVEDHNAVANDQLGVSKNLGQGQDPRGPDFVHGIKNVTGADPWNAARCIHGEPRDVDVQDDKDLGKSIKAGTRNVVRKAEDQHRAFGVPTIRKDIPYKDFRSVADYQNYGDEPEAVDLLFPSNYSEMGIEEKDFRQLRTRDEIRQMFEAIGYNYKIGKFNAIYNRAKEMGESTDDRVAVRDFQMAISLLHNIE